MARSSTYAIGRRTRPRPALLEPLESRCLLSAAIGSVATAEVAHAPIRMPVWLATNHTPAIYPKLPDLGIFGSVFAPHRSQPLGTTPLANTSLSAPFTPSQIRKAYGLDDANGNPAISFNGIVGDGSGQTIAIIGAYDDAKLVSSTDPAYASSDLHQFCAAEGIPDPPSFIKVSQTGDTSYTSYAPATGNNGTWSTEMALDVEWSHAIAPKANIILVECKDNSLSDLLAGVDWVRKQPAVTVISMSWRVKESSFYTNFDGKFLTPVGNNHPGITFLAATGDDGSYDPSAGRTAIGYPASSPNVVAVGGTSLTINSDGSYGGEVGWSGSGGGISSFESRPDYQAGVNAFSNRSNPDVSFNADPNTGVYLYDSNNTGGPWWRVGGTSFGTPAWAGLIAIANQGRAVYGLSSMDGRTQTLPALYQLPASDFHDITSGSNGGYSATVGYDMVTGRGTPIVNLLVPDLVSTSSISGRVFQDYNSNGIIDAGEPGVAGVTLYLDIGNSGTLSASDPIATSDTNGNYVFTHVPTGTYTARMVIPNGMAIPGPASFAVTVPSGGVATQDFALFPTTFGTSASDHFYVRLDATGTYLQISAADTPLTTPTYQIQLAKLPSLTFALGTGDDSLTLDFTHGSPVPIGGLYFDGGSGSNTLAIVGTGITDTYSLTGSALSRGSTTVLTYANLTNLSLSAAAVTDTSNLILPGVLTVGAASPARCTIAPSKTLTTGSFIVNANSGLIVNGTLVVAPTLNSTLNIVRGNLTVDGATDNWTGKLDLNNNDLLIQVPQGQDVNAAYATLVNQLNAGAQGGVWTGTAGVTSSSAANSGYTMGLGAVPNAQLNSFGIGYSAFDNVAVDDNSILVKYTLMGDVNLDGTIDSLDYYFIDSAFNNNQIPTNSTMTGYINGDFNYDGTIDSADYYFIDSNFNNQNATFILFN